MSAKARVLLVHNIMAPYRFPLFRALSAERDIQLTVWFMSQSARNRRWSQAPDVDLGFNYAVLPSIELNYARRDLFTYILNYTFPWRYLVERYDVLVSAGWLDFAAQAGFALSKLTHRKFILWSESTPYEPSWRRSFATPLVRTMVRHANACIAVGTRSHQYLQMLGAREPDIFTAISTVDVAHFRRTSSLARSHRHEYRTQRGIRRKRVILYCGQFIPRKGLRTLLDAFATVKRQFQDVSLVLVGYGPQQAELEWIVNNRQVEDVHFIGHVEVEDMPKLYALADIFVLPSEEETWGLVVNEAMACGLPVVVTDRVGAAPDLVDEGCNGYVIGMGDSAALASSCLELLRDDARLAQFSQCSACRILDFTPERAAAQFAQAIYHVMGRG
jgi:glycosyltransferase involved in cell wall biosynthesis